MNSHEKKKPLAFVILDGWGVGPKDKKINAIEAAQTPFFDSLLEKYPNTQLDATGRSVGLEEDQMSGSEAGHLNIGAGRVIKQDVRVILEEITNGKFFQNPVFLSTFNKVKKLNSNIHLMGLMGNSDSPHSHPDIFYSLLVLAKKYNLKGKVFFHFFTDGRDSFPKSAQEHWKRWKKMIDKIGIGELASVSGRFYAMDRTKNWDRLLESYKVLVDGGGGKANDFKEVVEFNYEKGNTDEYFKPAVIIKDNHPIATVENNDGVIFFNLRSDRARQFSKLFVGTHNEREKGFPKINHLDNLSFAAMTNFGPDLNLKTAYAASPVKCTLPFALSHLKQLYISEEEKYAHITYFINGGYADPIGGEDRIVVDSPNVKSYADKPEMASDEIAKVVTDNIKFGVYDFFTINFPNADMVGHTGDFEAVVKAVEILDGHLKNIYEELKKKDGTMIVTADHGNADVMVDKESGRLFTFHTKNPVPFIVASEDEKIKNLKLKKSGKLANIAPTILKVLDIYKPEEMTEDDLIDD
jgi:2,3-bisphosphoglycerate-independent phosphoglycerate mutase